MAEARLPILHGNFRIIAFRGKGKLDAKDHVVLVRGRVAGASGVPVRIHSECLTGDVFGSLRCDCHAQLQAALCKIGKMPRGLVIYLRQEGRGIGLANKIRAYALQEKGMDTVEANIALGFPSDMRDYGVAAAVLSHLKVKSIALITNNPDKIEKLSACGVKVARRIPHEFGLTARNRAYLRTKRDKMAHMLSKV
ncbi:MAG: GTP cyclohydrolase II [Candidatus Micrarchaeia archaeon]